jgi:hypothetical protein
VFCAVIDSGTASVANVIAVMHVNILDFMILDFMVSSFIDKAWLPCDRVIELR